LGARAFDLQMVRTRSGTDLIDWEKLFETQGSIGIVDAVMPLDLLGDVRLYSDYSLERTARREPRAADFSDLLDRRSDRARTLENIM
jgi:hypothetical protein